MLTLLQRTAPNACYLLSAAEITQIRAFKVAVIRPRLKKPSLIPDTFANYKPASDLPLISEILEKASSTFREVSSYATASRGTPQGSVLGSLHFMVCLGNLMSEHATVFITMPMTPGGPRAKQAAVPPGY